MRRRPRPRSSQITCAAGPRNGRKYSRLRTSSRTELPRFYRQVGARRPFVPRADEIARPYNARVLERIVGVGRPRAAVTIRGDFLARIDLVLLQQRQYFFRRFEPPILQKLGPFDVQRIG